MLIQNEEFINELSYPTDVKRPDEWLHLQKFLHSQTIFLSGAVVYYIKLQCPFVCLNVCLYPPPFRNDRRTATKFGTHFRIDTGLVLTYKN